ncbi:MAG: ATP-binding cassette domain-containing protein, partial [Eubacterium sp.]|nr:ATP-binding cassette domain-containing protein [Eubacterium sp.]
MSMIKVENLTFAYPWGIDFIFENVSFQIDTNWKLGFVGRNGRGKTTFLNLLLGKYEYSGKIISSVQFDYFPYSVEDKTMLTMEILQKVCPLAEEWEIMRELSLLDVDMDVLYRAFETLSNGEQTKALLAALFLNEGHFLLIDEPTNHLDMKTKDVLKEALLDFDGTIIVVSHDRYFLDGLTTKVYEFGGGKVKENLGGIYEFLQRKKIENLSELELSKSPSAPQNGSLKEKIQEKTQPNNIQKLSYAEQKERAKLISKAEKAVKKAE